MQELRKLLFPDHPYQNLPEGTENAIRSITREDLIAHHKKLTKAENLVIAVYGDIDPDFIKEQIATRLQDLPKGDSQDIAHTIPEATQDMMRIDMQAPREQAIVVTGFPALDIFDPALDALNILQTVLSGMNSPLFEEIREKRGLAYFTGASQQAGLHPGFFALYAGTAPHDAPEVEKLINKEIARICNDGLTEQEYKRAKAQMLASHDMRLQNQLGMAMDAALNELYGLGANYTLQFPERMDATTIEDVNKVAREIFNRKKQRTVVLLPEDTPTPTDAIAAPQ
jgi:zinc protease